MYIFAQMRMHSNILWQPHPSKIKDFRHLPQEGMFFRNDKGIDACAYTEESLQKTTALEVPKAVRSLTCRLDFFANGNGHLYSDTLAID